MTKESCPNTRILSKSQHTYRMPVIGDRGLCCHFLTWFFHCPSLLAPFRVLNRPSSPSRLYTTICCRLQICALTNLGLPLLVVTQSQFHISLPSLKCGDTCQLVLSFASETYMICDPVNRSCWAAVLFPGFFFII